MAPTFTKVDLSEETSYGPFNKVICLSNGDNYEIKAFNETGSSRSNQYLFEPELIKYYGKWDESIVSGDVKDGLEISKAPIYVFVNANPEDVDKPRVEIDFS